MAKQPADLVPKSRRRRWLQFSLRGLLILTLVVSLPLGWIGRELAHRRAELQLKEAIELAGGHVHWRSENRVTLPWSTEPDPFGESWTQVKCISSVRLPRNTRDQFAELFAQIQTHLFGLHNLDLAETDVTDSQLQGIHRLSELKELDLSGTYVSDEGIRNVARLQQLESLTLSFTNITDSSLVELARLPRLEQLDVSATEVTDAGVAKLRHDRPALVVTWTASLEDNQIDAARALRKLDWDVRLRAYPEYGGKLVFIEPPNRAELPTKPEIEWLQQLPRPHVTIRDNSPRELYDVFAGLDRLESLDSSGGVDDAILQRLAGCKNLRWLFLAKHRLSDNGLASLKLFPRLTLLNIDAIPANRRSVEHISQAKCLTALTLRHGDFHEGDLAPLAALSDLEQLDLRVAHFHSGATRPIGKLASLRILDLSNSNLDDEKLLPILNLSKLEELDVGSTRITDKGLLQLAGVRSLKKLKRSFAFEITDEGKRRFHELRPDISEGD